MKRPAQNEKSDNERIVWKRRPSEIRGYQKAIYVTEDNGDYVRVDYNLSDKKIRLYIELASEGGSPYYSVIKDGKITIERSVLTGRSLGFSDKFSSKSAVFNTIPSNTILKLIGGNYGISSSKFERTREKSTARTQLLAETRKKYFRTEDNPYIHRRSGGGSPGGPLSSKARVYDLLDLSVAFLLGLGAYFYFNYSFMAAGAVAAFTGVTSGIVDMFIRGREPFFIKVISLVAAGTALYVYGYYFSG